MTNKQYTPEQIEKIKKTKAVFQNIERKRLEYLNIFKERLIISILSAIATIPSTIYSIIWVGDHFTDNDWALIPMGIGGLILFSLYFYTKKPITNYIEFYKNKVLSKIMKSLNCHDYDPKGSGVKKFKFNNFKITPYYEFIKSSEDSFVQSINDIKADFTEVKLAKTVQTNKGSRTVVTFKGAAILVNMPFDFKSHTMIYKDTIFNKFSFTEKRVKLENPEFEKLFQVFSDDDHNTRYLLSPAVMERFVKLYNSFHNHVSCSGINCEFKDNQILILLNCSKNLLEPASLFTSALDTTKLKKTKIELKLLANLIQQLQLDYLADKKQAHKKLQEQLDNS